MSVYVLQCCCYQNTSEAELREYARISQKSHIQYAFRCHSHEAAPFVRAECSAQFDRQSECVCVCVCVCERERERERELNCTAVEGVLPPPGESDVRGTRAGTDRFQTTKLPHR